MNPPSVILADGINLPIVAALGLGVFVPLTLFVSLVESLTLRFFLRIPVKASFKRVVWANTVSTLAGWLVYAFQDGLIGWWGIETLYDFAHFYAWAALALAAIYYVKSVLVEGLLIVRRGFVERVGLTRRRLWGGVALANAASYLFVGPLFYFATRPTFPGVQMVKGPALVAACQDPVYYRDENFQVCKINADGSGRQVVLDKPVLDFMFSADRSSLVFMTRDQSLGAKDMKSGKEVVIGTSPDRMSNLDVSPDGQRVAFPAGREVVELRDRRSIGGHRGDDGSWQPEYRKRYRWTIRVVHLENGPRPLETALESSVDSSPAVAWDAQDPALLWCLYDKQVKAFRCGAEALQPEEKSLPPDLANTLRDSYSLYFSSRRRLMQGLETQGDLRMTIDSFIGSYMVIQRGEDAIMKLRFNYGVTGFRWGGPDCGAFLSATGRIVFQAGWFIYVGDVNTGQVAVLVRGTFQNLSPAWRDEESKEYLRSLCASQEATSRGTTQPAGN